MGVWSWIHGAEGGSVKRHSIQALQLNTLVCNIAILHRYSSLSTSVSVSGNVVALFQLYLFWLHRLCWLPHLLSFLSFFLLVVFLCWQWRRLQTAPQGLDPSGPPWIHHVCLSIHPSMLPSAPSIFCCLQPSHHVWLYVFCVLAANGKTDEQKSVWPLLLLNLYLFHMSALFT